MSTSDYQEQELTDGEELVAYLDGELPPDAARRVEERLASDADYRDQLRELDQVWEALDTLPRTSVDDDFARTTIEMVAVAAARDLSDRAAEVAQASRWRRLRMAAFAVVATAAGFAAATTLLPNDDQRLLDKLPVIRQLDLLTQVNDLEFLRGLAKVVPAEELKRDAATFDAELEAIHAASAPSQEERERWISKLSPEEKQKLWSQKDRFFDPQLPRVEQDRLETLQQEIANAEDAQELQRLMVAYEQWVSRRPGPEQATLRELTTDERVDMVRRLVREEGWRAARQLNNDEKNLLAAGISAITNEHNAAMFEDSEFIRRADDIDALRNRLKAQRALLELVTVSWELRSHNPEETRERLKAQLYPQTRAYLELGDRWWQSNQLRQWILEVLPLGRDRDQQALMDFWSHRLTNEQKGRLSNLLWPEFQAELATMYDAEQKEIQGLEWLIGRPRRGGGRGRGAGGQRGPNERGRGRGGRGRGGPGGRARGEPASRGDSQVDRSSGPPNRAEPTGGDPNDAGQSSDEQKDSEMNNRRPETGGGNGAGASRPPEGRAGSPVPDVQQLLEQRPQLNLVPQM